MANGRWTTLLLIPPASHLDPSRVAVFSSPTDRFFVARPYPDAAHEEEGDQPPGPLLTGWSRLPDAVRHAAQVEATIRRNVRNLAGPVTWLEVRQVLWETQPTPSHVHASLRVQRALTVALSFPPPTLIPTGGGHLPSRER